MAVAAIHAADLRSLSALRPSNVTGNDSEMEGVIVIAIVAGKMEIAVIVREMLNRRRGKRTVVETTRASQLLVRVLTTNGSKIPH